ncbi:epithelial splicing regulatory protein 1 [Trichonephila clavipes]|uniref:Epithelial splicing regulatory protein 1 n=1 Tax=Trichonephila clavipes TaxID=2585209 RepID=A0A8X6ST11_TRICX|nr:epithelial splicing regulatory protein 1 [Trichonephila clavipes]
MDCPEYSPDLNPIEHTWDMLGRRITARQPPPICLPEPRRALLDEWCNIPQDHIDNLILSMARCYRMTALENGSVWRCCRVKEIQCLNQMHKEETSFVKERKKEKPAASPAEKVTKKQKNSANSSSATAESPSEYT